MLRTPYLIAVCVVCGIVHLSCDSKENAHTSRAVPKIKNGKFEEGMQDWQISGNTTGKVLWNSADVGSDRQSFVRFTLDSIGSRAGLTQRIPYAASNNMRLSVKAIARGTLSTDFARILVECINENAAYNESEKYGCLESHLSEPMKLTSDWRDTEVVFVVPPKTTLLRVFFNVYGEGHVDLSEIAISEAHSPVKDRGCSGPGTFRGFREGSVDVILNYGD